MRSSLLAVIAILGTMTNDTNAVTIEKRHHHHPHHQRLLQDAGEKEDPENAKIVAAIKKEEADAVEAEATLAKSQKVAALKEELKAELAPKILSEDEEKEKVQGEIKQLEQDALNNDNLKKVDDIKEKLETATKTIEAAKESTSAKDAKETKEAVDTVKDLQAKKADSEAFIAKYNLDVKTDAAEKSVKEVVVAEKKLLVAKLDADVKKVKDEEEKVKVEISEKIDQDNAKEIKHSKAPEDPKMKAFEEGVKKMAAEEEEKEEKLEEKKKALELNVNPGIKAAEEKAAKFDDEKDKYAEERAAFEAKKAAKLAAEKALETQRIQVMARSNSDNEDYIASLPQHHFNSAHVYDRPCAAGGCFGSKDPRDGGY